ncbi:MAG: DNA repair protein RecO [Balneolaceae bacterium]|nr:DNA repair protein RecO [Balneolaceae bacterium]
MIVHTSAIVFRSVDFQESSKIVTLFTEEHGKIAVLVRGAKKPKNKFSGLIDPGNILDVVYYHKDSRSVQILSEASYLDKTLNLRTEFEKMAIATSAIELINQLLHDNEVNRPLFTFTRDFLVWLDRAEPPLQAIFPYLQIRLADLMGLGLGLQRNISTDARSYYLNVETGMIADDSETSHSYKLTQNQYNYVNLALQSRSAKLLNIALTRDELRQLVNYLDRYLKYHVEGLKDRKSDAIFEQLLQDPL